MKEIKNTRNIEHAKGIGTTDGTVFYMAYGDAEDVEKERPTVMYRQVSNEAEKDIEHLRREGYDKIIYFTVPNHLFQQAFDTARDFSDGKISLNSLISTIKSLKIFYPLRRMN